MSIFAAINTKEINPSNDNGFSTTLTLCTEALENAIAAIATLRETFNAFGENYVDVDEETFVNRAPASYAAFESLFYAAHTMLFSVNSQLETAKALAKGAKAISENNSAANHTNSTVEKEVI